MNRSNYGDLTLILNFWYPQKFDRATPIFAYRLLRRVVPLLPTNLPDELTVEFPLG